ncbi:MAG: MFS transporter, partial [Chloroflexota bacterium]
MRLLELISYPRRMFYGWRMVVIGLIVNAVGGGIFNQGFAVFFLPISRDLDLSRAQTSLIFSLSRAEGAIDGPISGWLVDRFGPKYILFGGALLAGIGYLFLAQVDSYGMFLLVYLGLISVSFNAGFSHPVMSVANAWFIRKRG